MGRAFSGRRARRRLSSFPDARCQPSTGYTNPLGIAMGRVRMYGFCERFGCANYSKPSPQTTVLPAPDAQIEFRVPQQMRGAADQSRRARKRATGVTYVDAQGQEWEQLAEIVLLAPTACSTFAWLLVSKIGQPYDPQTGEPGTVGRNYYYQTNSARSACFFDDKNFNPFIAAGASGQTADDFNGDAFDHDRLILSVVVGINCIPTNGRPIGRHPTPPGTPRWGSAWKKARRGQLSQHTCLYGQGSELCRRAATISISIRPIRDRFGRPLMRMTFDFPDNDIRMSANWVTEQSLKRSPRRSRRGNW